MKVLLIDSGNSRVKVSFLVSEQGAIQAPLTIDHAHLHQLKDWFSEANNHPDLVYGVNVASAEVALAIVQQLPEYSSVRWLRAQSQLLHLKNHYEVPELLGADRFFALLGISSRIDSQEMPFILANFGTATTIDTVYKNQFLGGMILPGLQLMSESLYHGTAQLPTIDWQTQLHVSRFATNTQAAIETGILSAQAGAILCQWHQVRATYQKMAPIYVAGGAYANVLSTLRTIMQRSMTPDEFATIKIEKFENPVLEGLGQYAADQIANFLK